MPTKEQILDLILMTIAQGARIPERAEVETQIKGLLSGFPHLSESRECLLSKVLEVLVTIVKPAEELVDPNQYQAWIKDTDRTAWSAWPWLRLYLKNRLRRPVRVLEELDRSTDRILDLLGDPKRAGLWDRRGLVVGHVQSGKTQHYTALAAKAIDAGYKAIIILSGIHENLRQQTQERIEECITGKNSRKGLSAFGVREYQVNYLLDDAPMGVDVHGNSCKLSIPDVSTLTSVAGDFGSVANATVNVPIGSQPVVFVIKKNTHILKNVLIKLRGTDKNKSFQPYPVLVIDDEADHSSPNSAREDEDPKRINEQIRKILWCCDKVAFVGYTATPYANIFMDDHWVEKTQNRNIDDYGSDLFPSAFIISLEAPTNYIGPENVFGRDADESIDISSVSPLPMQITVDDADAWLDPRHKNGFEVKSDLPPSLRMALRCFVLSVAARMALGQDSSHCSMLVHVTRFNSVQNEVMNQIRAYMDSTHNLLIGGVDRGALWDEFRELWDSEFVSKFPKFETHPSQQNDPPALPDWVNVEERLNEAFCRLTFPLVNSLTREGLDFAENASDGLVVIAVGGDRLSRGLTLEGLTVSYFLRGARAYDTLMQMGRWFGYRPGYAHLCRVFAPKSIISNFRTIVLATEELRSEFARMCYLHRTPSDYGLQVREPRGDMLVTALNRMRRGQTVRIRFADSLISSLEIKEEDLEANHTAFRELTDSLQGLLGRPRIVDSKGNDKANGASRIWNEVPWENLIPFISRYNATNNDCLDRGTSTSKSLLHSYIESVVNQGDLITWTVAVIGSTRGKQGVDGMDSAFHVGKRVRLMQEIPEWSENPKNRGKVSFKGMGLGGDEALDLTEVQREEALRQHKEKDNMSRAAIFRSMRPSTNGLLLIYPIIPETPVAANKKGIADEAYLWKGKKPVIGIAVSLPSSKHDKGCNYVCAPQKLREIFGDEVAEDLERDEEEMPAASASNL
jgi:hypothetical protein